MWGSVDEASDVLRTQMGGMIGGVVGDDKEGVE
jgi:hypothetical protein